MMNIERRSLESGLEAIVYSHELNNADWRAPAWTVLTEGLSAAGQDEVVLTIVRSGDCSTLFPDTVLAYLKVVRELASQGKKIGPGGLSGFRSPGPFRFGGFTALTFFDAPSLEGIEIPDSALTGVFLREGELAMAMTSGVLRVLNRLGKQAMYFPTPYWSDPTRATAYSTADAEQTILTRFLRVSDPAASATLSGDAMTLSLPPELAAQLADRLEADVSCAVLPPRKPDIRAALVWAPGQLEPEAIFDGTRGEPPTSFAAVFVALVPNVGPEDEIRFMEDGFAAILCEASTRSLTRMLRKSGDLEVRSANGRTLRVMVE